ncbi:MAG TPA: GNAT family protein [Solirubrobacteraceae bacterium]|nr:GNAT family protein [Solirubrobacteraceae bacterium]
MPSFPILPAPLTGRLARLRPAAERDIPEVLIAHQDDPGLHAALGERRPPSGAELGRRAEAAAAELASGTRAWLTICEGEDDECRGQLDVFDVEWAHGRARLTVWVAPHARGRGLGAEALGLSARWLLGDCGLVRLALLCEPANAPALAAARCAGFVHEGVLRAHERREHRRVDLAVLSLIAGDPAAGADPHPRLGPGADR